MIVNKFSANAWQFNVSANPHSSTLHVSLIYIDETPLLLIKCPLSIYFRKVHILASASVWTS